MCRLGAVASLLMLIALEIGGCSSQPTFFLDHDSAFDFKGFRTYRWYDDVVPSEMGGYRQYNSSDKRVRTYINRELADSGFTQIRAGDPDFLVNYSVSREEKMQISNFAGYPDAGMHGGVGAGTYGSGFSVGYSSGPEVRSYQEGTVVIDIIDRREGRIVWRSIAEGRLSKSLSVAEKDARASRLARELMSAFPPEADRAR